ncbi:hypothetical protein D5086_005742 [Populus alba]|uniref:Uncharacterized protein n=1 Tax=Populus alba TaxID=43335 RepID=A0ACC4CVS5_POPAL
MEDQDASSSMISSAKSPTINVETLAFSRSNKLGRLHSNIGNVAKFKGIVPQKNGHWGAQIYSNHQRIWLGTFKTEKEAAMAYDSAAIKLRSTDSHRNFPWNDRNVQEPSFQNQYSTEEILNMIRDGSYQQIFVDFIMKQSQREEIGGSDDPNGRRMRADDEQFSCIQLFQKDLTPIYCNGQSGKVDGFNQTEDVQRELAVVLRQNMRKKLQKDGKELKEEKEILKNKAKQKGFRLFGVQINEVELQLQPCSQTGAIGCMYMPLRLPAGHPA